MNNNTVGKWAKVRVAPKEYKILKKLAVDEDTSLADLFKQALKMLIKERKKDDNKENKGGED